MARRFSPHRVCATMSLVGDQRGEDPFGGFPLSYAPTAWGWAVK